MKKSSTIVAVARVWVPIAALALGLGMASRANAQVVAWDVPLDGAQAVPPTGSPGTGFCKVTLDKATGAVTVDGTFSGLTTPAIAAHIHLAPAGVPGPVIIPLTATAATAGTITGGGNIGANQAAMQAAGTYINLHSVAFPGGEIRGQIDTLQPPPPIPTVSQWGLIVMGLLLLTAGTIVIRRYKAHGPRTAGA